MGERYPGARQFGRDAERLRPEPGQDDPRVELLSPEHPQTCIYPGCERTVVGPHTLGGPPSAFCDLEEHNALSAHQERLARAADNSDDEEVDRGR